MEFSDELPIELYFIWWSTTFDEIMIVNLIKSQNIKISKLYHGNSSQTVQIIEILKEKQQQ